MQGSSCGKSYQLLTTYTEQVSSTGQPHTHTHTHTHTHIIGINVQLWFVRKRASYELNERCSVSSPIVWGCKVLKYVPLVLATLASDHQQCGGAQRECMIC